MLSKWKLKTTILVLCAISSIQIYAAKPSVTLHAKSPAPYDAAELEVVKKYLFQNILTDTSAVTKNDNGYIIHSIPGAVEASPSNKGENFSQDYQFHWTRDAAITMKEVIQLYADAPLSLRKQLKSYLLNYIEFEAKAQKQISHNGHQTLGQPKFNIDGNLWEGAWGRPQNDGAALRASALMDIANLFLNEGEEKIVHERLLNMILADLDYVAANWNTTSFDLWEEINDVDHFFNKMVQRKALIEGASFLRRFNKFDQAKKYIEVSVALTESLQKHWNANLGYFSETINQQYIKGGGLDSSILLGVLYGDLKNNNDAFAVNNERVMSSIYYLRNSFAGLYRINIDEPTSPTLMGRYPSDVYDGNQMSYGNPWILITNALAQYYYSLAEANLRAGEIRITKATIPFFNQVEKDLAYREEVINSAKNPTRFYQINVALLLEGDRILQRVKKYSTCYADNTCLHFAEQIDRATGQSTSAKDLTWGYATILSAINARGRLPN